MPCRKENLAEVFHIDDNIQVTHAQVLTYAVDSFFQTIRSRLWHLVHFLCASQVNYASSMLQLK